MITDLSKLLPQNDNLIFYASKEKKKYRINMFIPSAVELVASNVGENLNDGFHNQKISVLKIFLSTKIENVEEVWINENLSLEVQNYIFNEIIRIISKGTLKKEELEKLTPKKKAQKKTGILRGFFQLFSRRSAE